MHKKSIGMAIALLVVGSLGGVVADRLLPIGNAQAGVKLDAAERLIDAVTHGQAQAKKVFPGPGGLTGVVIEAKQHPLVAWITPGGKYLAVGPLLNAQGQDETRLAMEKLDLLPKVMAPADFAQLASKEADSFVLGKTGPELTAFVDPNCIFCHKFYEQAQPLINAGKLRVRFVIVGFLKPDSAPRAAAILGAKDPQAAMAENEKGFDAATEEGGIKPMDNPPPALRAAVENNTKLLAKSGELATPTLIYCDKKTGLKVIHGLPQEGLTGLMGELGNLQGGVCKE